MTTTVSRLGSRGSALALAQARLVAEQLTLQGITVTVQIISTVGDRVTDRIILPADGKGVFVSEIEQALLDGTIDLAVHSMKDMPAEMPAELILAAVPVREDPRDVLIIGNGSPTLAALPGGANIGTSSPRRRAQLLAFRPDLRISEMRGNIDTRLRKLEQGEYDAICLAAAGMHRLGLRARITEYLEYTTMLPAVGQGALAVQTRRADKRLCEALTNIHDERSARAVRAERAVLATLGGGCNIPLGVIARVEGNDITLKAALCNLDGTDIIHAELSSSVMSAEEIGLAVGRRLAACQRLSKGVQS
jgi:hydroxymethylbilane synthase